MIETQTIPVALGVGVDTKTDEKNLPVTKLSLLENMYLSKGGTLKTRNGQGELSNSIFGGGTISSARASAVLDDELLIAQNDTMYSFADTIDKWVPKGSIINVSTSKRRINCSYFAKSHYDIAHANNIIVVAWIESRRGTYTEATSYEIRASVIDRITGTAIIHNVQISAAATLSGLTVRCISIGQYIFVVFDEGANLRAVRIDSLSPTAFEAAFNLATNFDYCFDIVTYDSTAAVFAYRTTVANTNMTFGYLKSDKTIGNGVNGYPSPVNIVEADTFLGSQCLMVQPSTGDVYIVYSAVNGTQSRIKVIGRIGTTLGAKLASTTVENGPATVLVHGDEIGAIFETNSSIRAFWGRTSAGINHTNTNILPKIHTCTISDVGAIGSISLFKSQTKLGSMPFKVSGVVYVNVIYLGDMITQPTYFTLKYDGTVYGKYFQGEAQSYFYNGLVLPNVVNTTGSIYEFVIKVASDFSPSFGLANGLFMPGAKLQSIIVDFATSPSLQKLKANKNVELLSNLLHHYDGGYTVEHGFHIFPDSVEIQTTRFVSSVTQQGTGILPEITSVTCPHGHRVRNNGTVSQFNGAGVARVICFRVDGYSLGAGDINVDVLSTDTDLQVATKLKNAVDAHADFIATVAGKIVTITNAANGAVTDANYDTTNGPSYGYLSAGVYSWKVVYEWPDASGNIYRSAPSPAVSATVVQDKHVTLGIPPCQFTNKVEPSAKVVVNVYRTLANGSTYYLVQSNYEGIINDLSRELLFFIDYVRDSDLATHALLYTEGGVIENIAPPSATTITATRKRLFLGGLLEDEYGIWHSKELIEGQGYSFSDAFKLRVDEFGGPVRGLASMDEKIIALQEDAIMYFVGNGPNDLGSGGSFSPPEYISKDVGCDNPSSIAYNKDGVFFHSKKGYYFLNRGLQLIYIGADIESLNTLTISAAVAIPNTHQIRLIHSNGNAGVLDHYYNQWGMFTNHSAVDAGIWNDLFFIVRSDGKVWQETPGIYKDPTNVQIVAKAETAWIRLLAQQGFQRISMANILGLFPTAYNHILKTKVDFNDSVIDTHTYSSGSDSIEFGAQIARQKCEAIKLRYENSATGAAFSPCELTGFTLEIGVKKGLNKLPASQSV